ncbi:multidrug resistance-associated protein 1 [Thraustotheca clavata]|uniref:Multidrug resistance-associated protein 1 n=1 Tax=Thraustotheca clavata TaxID=74557 RepID=A0A1V9Z3N2_9STRA|nr:multidrug resistance-associated protein 1 [Thraustotheca clavata]
MRSYNTFAKSPLGNPKDKASYFSRLFISWCDPILTLGNTKQLNLEDIWPLDANNSCALTCEELKANWTSSGSLLKAFLQCYGKIYIGIGFLLAFAYGCDLLGPLILNQVVLLVSAEQVDFQLIWIWLAVLFVSRVMKALIFGHVYKETQIIAIKFSAAIKSLIFQKSFRLCVESRLKKSTGDIVNLYTTDVSNILMAAYYIHEIWILPTEILIALYLLHSSVGLAAFAGLGVIIVVLIINQVMAKSMASAFTQIMTLKNERMKALNEIFSAIQIVKLNAWEPKFLTKIRVAREKELDVVWKYLYIGALNIFVLWGAPMFVSTTTIAVYAFYMKETLTAAKIFTALALFRLMQEPFRSLPKIITGIIQAQVSMDRLIEFYQLPERKQDVIVGRENAIRCTTMDDKNVIVSIENGTFAWTSAGESLFKHVNFEAKNGELIVVHGKVDSGKSSLCSLLLGDMQHRVGSVYVGGSIGYCSQQPWIQNLTIRDNICFGRPYDKKKYLKVLEACGLVADIQSLPGGDKTEIGQKGLNLSGDQKARIALARACYSDSDILLLDAPLAAVDNIVVNEIFQKCILGLLRHKTRILITHNPDFINSKHADSVLLLANGQLHHTQTIDKKPLGPPPVSPLIGVQFARRKKGNKPEETKPSSVAFAFTSPSQLIQDGLAPLVSRSSSFLRVKAQDGQLITDEERHEGRVAKHVFVAYFHAMGGIWVCFFLILVQCAWQALMQGSDFYLAYWTGESSTDQVENTKHNLTIYTLLALGSSALVLVRTMTVSLGGLHAARTLFDRMTKSLIHAPMTFFDSQPLGRILNRYSDDISRVDFQLPFAYGSLLAIGFSVGCTLITACVVTQYFGLLVIPILVIYIRIGLYYLQPARELQRLQKVTTSPILAHLSEANDGSSVIRAFGMVSRFCNENASNIDNNNRTVYLSIVSSSWFALRMQLLGGVIVVVIAVALTLLQPVLSPGLIGLAFNYGLAVDQGLEGLIQAWSWLETSMVSPERIQKYIDVPSEASYDKDKVVVPPKWPNHGAIDFENVTLKYNSNGKNVLDSVNFNIKAGEKIGIVGRTGAGMSSLAMALFRLHELASGRILIDGIDISQMGLLTLRSRLCIITQSPILFKGTIRGYLDPFDERTDHDIWAALGKVELTTIVSSIDGKLDAPLDENGDNLSVGERQLLCMARSLLSKARVVIMDEATAAIDAENDAKLQKVIRSEFNDATLLTIAHRLDSVLDSNRIMVMDAGKVVQFASPMSLIARGEGPFYNLAKEGGYVDRVAK